MNLSIFWNLYKGIYVAQYILHVDYLDISWF